MHPQDIATIHGRRISQELERPVRRERFRNGRATSVELTDSEVQLTRAGVDAVNARANLRFARASLLHATGRDIPPSVRAARSSHCG